MAIKSANTILATIQHRRGQEEFFDPSQMTAGEWAVSTDSKKVWMCFQPGLVLRMATYEAFEKDMEEIRQILVEAQDIQAAIEAWNYLAESYAHGGTGKREGEDTDNAKYYSEQAKIYSENAEAVTGIGIMTTEKAGIGKPDGETITADEDGTLRVIGGGGGASGDFASKEIYGDTAISLGRAEGSDVGDKSIAYGDGLKSSGEKSVSFGIDNESSGKCSKSSGRGCKSSGNYSASCGIGCESSGNYSASFGYYSESRAQMSFSFGRNLIAGSDCQLAIGRYNVNDGTPGYLNNIFIVGNGSSDKSRENKFRIHYDGNVYSKGAYNSIGADYAEFIRPWHDGNQENEDRVGYFVTVKDGYLYKANEGDYIAGIVSGAPSIVGNSDEEYYWRWKRDEFNRVIYEEVSEMTEKIDDSGEPVIDEETGKPVMIETRNTIKVAKQSEDYDPSKQSTYVERKDRKEWDYVGMLGVLPVRDDGTCEVGRYCRCADGGIATIAEERGFDTYMVIERISENIVSVILK